MLVRKAKLADLDDLYSLINSAYRGDSSRAGWTTEADLLGGLRINRHDLESIFTRPRETLLVFEADRLIEGCVHLTRDKNGDVYLGMLTVNPKSQGQGTGANLLKASEDFAREHHAPRIYMTVITVRNELIAYYKRKGYRQADTPAFPFPKSDDYVVLKEPLEMLTLEKLIS
jgi:N-acetylglutamate synthase-like GNAT family acetyltransferase